MDMKTMIRSFPRQFFEQYDSLKNEELDLNKFKGNKEKRVKNIMIEINNLFHDYLFMPMIWNIFQQDKVLVSPNTSKPPQKFLLRQ